MKKILLATTIMAVFSVQAQNVSQADIEAYLNAHPEVVRQYTENQQKPAPKGSFLDSLSSAPASVVDEIIHNPSFYSVGNPEGTFVIIGFFDYQCGWCKKSHEALTKMLESDKAKNIRIIPVSTPIFGENSELMAKYVWAAGKQGKFKEMNHAVFTAGGHVDEETLLEIGRSLGLDTKRLTEDAQSQEMNQLLATANGYKTKMNIAGVPMFIVNGKVQSGAILDEKTAEILNVQDSVQIYGGSDEVQVRSAPSYVAAPTPAPVQQPVVKMAPKIMDMIKKAREEGILQADGRFSIVEDDKKLVGQIFCSDTELDAQMNAFENEVNKSEPDEEAMRVALDKVLRCISISDLVFPDNDVTLKFTGNYRFPAFADKSKGSIKVEDKTIDFDFKLAGNNQTTDISVYSKTGAKLAFASLEYDAERMSVPFEWGAIGGMLDYVGRKADFEETLARQLQIWAQENDLMSDEVFKINKAEIYQPDGKKVLVMNGEDANKSILRVFSSIEREFFNASWTDELLKINLSFPKSGNRIFAAETKFPATFRENYKKFSEEYRKQAMVGKVDPAYLRASGDQVVQLLAGLKQEVTLYGLDGQPVAGLKAKLNDTITSTKRPEDVIDYVTLSILKPSMNCSLKSVTFSKANPNVVTMCDANGCSEQQPFAAFSQVGPCLETEVRGVFEQFGEEIKEEISKLEQVYVPGFSDGYGMAMSRYRANEILNASAMVAIVAMSAQGGMGADADLSDLGGYKSMKLEDMVLSDYAIRSNKDGVVTIEVNPKIAKDVLPIIKELSGSRVESGCTADTNACVLNMARSAK